VAGTKNPEHFKKEKEYLAQQFVDIGDAGLNFKIEMEICGATQGDI
jgi:hypothetical protein